jgi:hypothetical protein
MVHNQSLGDSPASNRSNQEYDVLIEPSTKLTHSPRPGNKDHNGMMERQADMDEIAPDIFESGEVRAEIPDPETEQRAILDASERFNERKESSSAKYPGPGMNHDISKASAIASSRYSERKKKSLAQENVTFKDNNLSSVINRSNLARLNLESPLSEDKSISRVRIASLDKTHLQSITGKVKKSITSGNLEIIEDRHRELRTHSLQDRRSSTRTPVGSNNSAPLRDSLENQQYSTREHEPRIQVSIGRIEVKATASPPPKNQSRSASPLLSLDEYLRQRAGGNGR